MSSVLLSRRHVLNGRPVKSMVLQSPDSTKWVFQIGADGAFIAYSGASGAVDDIKITGGSDVSGVASIGISNAGELQVKNGVDLSATAVLNDDFRVRSIDGVIYKIDISALDQIQLTQV